MNNQAKTNDAGIPSDEDVIAQAAGAASEAPVAEGAAEAQPEARASPAEEVAELKDRLLRTLADMENLRRRTQREIEETRKYAVTNFARGLLDVADNLARALGSVPAEAIEQDPFLKNLVDGVGMTERQLLALFEKHEIKRVEPVKGERFDHKLHQAMFEVTTDELPAGSVAEVLQPGYVIADRLLRPAMVGVAKGQARPSDGEPAGAKVDMSA